MHFAVVTNDGVEAGTRRAHAQHRDAVRTHAAGDDVDTHIGGVGRCRGVSDTDGVDAARRRYRVIGHQISHAAGGVECKSAIIANDIAIRCTHRVNGDSIESITADNCLVTVGGDDDVIAAHHTAVDKGLQLPEFVRCAAGHDAVVAVNASIVADDHILAVCRAVGHHKSGRVDVRGDQNRVRADATDNVVVAQEAGRGVVLTAHADGVAATRAHRGVGAEEASDAAARVGLHRRVVTGDKAEILRGRRAGGKSDGVLSAAADHQRRTVAQVDCVISTTGLGKHCGHRVDHMSKAVGQCEGFLAQSIERGLERHLAVISKNNVGAGCRIHALDDVAAIAGQNQVVAGAQIDGVRTAAQTVESPGRQRAARGKIHHHQTKVGHDGVIALAGAADVEDVATQRAEFNVVAAAALDGVPAHRDALVFQRLALPDPHAPCARTGAAEAAGATHGLQREVVSHVDQAAGLGRLVFVSDECIGDQQVVTRAPLDHVDAAVAHDQVVAAIADQRVAAGAAEYIVEAAHRYVAGAAKAAHALLVDDHARSRFGEIDGVARIGCVVAGNRVQTETGIAVDAARKRGVGANAEHVAARAADGIFKAHELETEAGVVAHRRLRSARGEPGLRLATGAVGDPASVAAGDGDQQVGRIAREVEDVAARAALDRVDGIGCGKGHQIAALYAPVRAVVQRHRRGLRREVKDVGATGVGDVGRAPTSEEAVGIIAGATLHMGGAAARDQFVIATATL